MGISAGAIMTGFLIETSKVVSLHGEYPMRMTRVRFVSSLLDVA